MGNPFERALGRDPANHVPLSPLSLLARAAAIYPRRAAWIHGERQADYATFFGRCRRLASALAARGIGVGDTVAVMAPNIPPLLEAHYGVPAAGAVLNAINTRQDAATIAYILDHGEAKVVLVDRELATVMKDALALATVAPLVIDIDDVAESGAGIGAVEYEAFLAEGDPDHAWRGPADEWQAISLNYTSGTTGEPKGVVYHHRGAYLNAIGNVLAWGLPAGARYLWALPMFHCNGWCFTWALSVVAGTHVCMRKVESGAIFTSIAEHDISHFCGAPVVLNMLANAPANKKRRFERTIEVATGGAAPPAAVLSAMEAMGLNVTHLYGLTECYGPATVCAWQNDWDALPATDQAVKLARQGVAYPTIEAQTVADPETLAPVPADGATIGEVMLRGNTVMKGYLKDAAATKAAFRGGWFHTGDLAVLHGDGYIEVKDRSKDIILSGGENVSTIEIESVLYRHPAILEAAVVAKPDKKWGETPCAFVTLKDEETSVTDTDIIAFCRDNMAHFKTPKAVVFGPLPKTSTGKIQKFALRERARNLP